MKTHTKLSATERRLLSEWKQEGLSNAVCAKRLSRHPSTIGRELTRNRIRVTTAHGKDWEYTYEPLHAHAVAEKRQTNAWNAKEPLKNTKVYAYVLRHLRKGWSPEQIAGRLKDIHRDDPSWHICHETIYQFIYKEKTEKRKQKITEDRVLDHRIRDPNGQITVTDCSHQLWEYLRRKQTKRRKRSGRKVARVRIPDRVSIHTRPAIIETRKEFGHWEGDSIVGKGHTSGLHTEYERLSRYIRFERMERITGDAFEKAANTIFDDLPPHAKRSTTLDNGSEHITHGNVGKQQHMDVYFADPYASYQRGGNENGNLWIRYYFPKGTDFHTISTEELQDVQDEINNRPRKILKYKTPQEVFTAHLEKLTKGCDRL